jgi:antitoxin component YwqK of YwqJK toxin-antitoxin module
MRTKIVILHLLLLSITGTLHCQARFTQVGDTCFENTYSDNNIITRTVAHNKTKTGNVFYEKNFDDNGLFRSQTCYDNSGNKTWQRTDLHTGEKTIVIIHAGTIITTSIYINGVINSTKIQNDATHKTIVKQYNDAGKIISQTTTVSDTTYTTTYGENGNVRDEIVSVNNQIIVGSSNKNPANGNLADDDGSLTENTVLYQANGKDTVIPLLSGQQSAYYKTGEERVLFKYSDGKLNGVQTVYYKSHAVSIEIPYANGKVEGNLKSYYPDGKLKNITPYKAGKPNGKQMLYDNSGTEWLEGQYVSGVLNGLQVTKWSSSQIDSNFYVNGIQRVHKSYKNGIIISYVIFEEDGKNLKALKEFNPDGSERTTILHSHDSTATLLNGKLKMISVASGDTTTLFTYDDNGNLMAMGSVRMINGAIDKSFQDAQKKAFMKQIRKEVWSSMWNDIGSTLVKSAAFIETHPELVNAGIGLYESSKGISPGSDVNSVTDQYINRIGQMQAQQPANNNDQQGPAFYLIRQQPNTATVTTGGNNSNANSDSQNSGNNNSNSANSSASNGNSGTTTTTASNGSFSSWTRLPDGTFYKILPNGQYQFWDGLDQMETVSAADGPLILARHQGSNGMGSNSSSNGNSSNSQPGSTSGSSSNLATFCGQGCYLFYVEMIPMTHCGKGGDYDTYITNRSTNLTVDVQLWVQLSNGTWKVGESDNNLAPGERSTGSWVCYANLNYIVFYREAGDISKRFPGQTDVEAMMSH